MHYESRVGKASARDKGQCSQVDDPVDLPGVAVSRRVDLKFFVLQEEIELWRSNTVAPNRLARDDQEPAPMDIGAMRGAGGFVQNPSMRHSDVDLEVMSGRRCEAIAVNESVCDAWYCQRGELRPIKGQGTGSVAGKGEAGKASSKGDVGEVGQKKITERT